MTGVLERFAGTEWTVDSLRRSGYGELPGWELLDGRLEKKMGKGFRHYNTTRLLHKALDLAFGTPDWCTFFEAPIQLDPGNLPEPDVSVVSRRSLEEERDARAEEVRLVVEVSYTTQDDDFGHRLSRYARAGIGEYWVVDVSASGALHIYTEPEGDGYLRHRLVVGDDEVPYVTRPLRSVLSDEPST